ncbi:MAG: hypothetical protein ACRDY0_06535, partial [Acidimicrobiales bacterium]
ANGRGDAAQTMGREQPRGCWSATHHGGGIPYFTSMASHSNSRGVKGTLRDSGAGPHSHPQHSGRHR